MSPLLLFLLAAGSTQAFYDFKNWYAAEVTDGQDRSCSFALSPNFYGVVIRSSVAQSDFDVSIDSPGVHVLPSDVAIPLKIKINGQIQPTQGRRIDRKLVFSISPSMVNDGLARKGMIQIILSAPGIPDTLIARYRLRGSDYLGSVARFQACSKMLHAQSQDPVKVLALN